MTEGLEAFNKIKNDSYKTHEEECACYEIVEKELKRLEQLEIMYFNCVIEGAKQKKALEIIKEKGIILQFIKETYTVEQYNAGVFGTLVKPLTQEEYDLLKEVLL